MAYYLQLVFFYVVPHGGLVRLSSGLRKVVLEHVYLFSVWVPRRYSATSTISVRGKSDRFFCVYPATSSQHNAEITCPRRRNPHPAPSFWVSPNIIKDGIVCLLRKELLQSCS